MQAWSSLRSLFAVDAEAPLPVAGVLDALLTLATPTPKASETVELLSALNRVLAADVTAPRDWPTQDLAAMDGFAIQAADAPGEFSLVGQSRAGAPCRVNVAAGQCVQITTGAALPAGANAVVPHESSTSTPAGRIRVSSPVGRGANVRARASDQARCDVLFTAGTWLDARHIGALASLGLNAVQVKPQLRVGVMSVGDELLQPGSVDAASAQAAFDSNRFFLLSAIRSLGCVGVNLACIADDEAALAAATSQALPHVDVLLCSGGAGGSAADPTARAWQSLGDCAALQLALKPGKPLVVAQFKSTIFGEKTAHAQHKQGISSYTNNSNKASTKVLALGLPGNPAAAHAAWRLLVEPVLMQLQGRKAAQMPQLQAKVDEAATPGNRTVLLRASLAFATGQWHAAAQSDQSSASAVKLAQADALIVHDGNGQRVFMP